MPFTTACPNCSARLQVPDTLAGKRVRCKKCHEPFLVEAPIEDEDVRVSKKAQRADDRGVAGDDEDERPARKKKKKKKKEGVPPLVIGLVVGGVILVGGGLAAFILLKDDKKPDSELAEAKGKSSGEADGAPWVDYRDAEAKYRVKFPSPPQVQNQTAQTPLGPQVLKVAVLQRGPANFIANSLKLPVENVDPEQYLDGVAAEAGKGIPNATLNGTPTKISHNGVPGREMLLTVPGGATGVARIFVSNGRQYSLAVVGLNVTPATPVAKTFFDSLVFE
jgi:hypothetical protein